MSQVQYDVSYSESRNRGTVAIRLILAIPHLILMTLWGYAAQAAALIQWFIVVFTGKRNEGIFNFQNQWLGYASRVLGYSELMYDEYPKFGNDASGVPTTYDLTYEEPANRLTNGLRLIWAIPALIIGIGIGIALYVLAVIRWFILVITGKDNRGMWDFSKRAIGYISQMYAYLLLMTDTYPKY